MASIPDMETLLTVFPSQCCVDRPFADRDGSINFDPAVGILHGGLLRPHLSPTNPWKLQYDWFTQSLNLEIFIEHYVCMARRPEEPRSETAWVYKEANGVQAVFDIALG